MEYWRRNLTSFIDLTDEQESQSRDRLVDHESNAPTQLLNQFIDLTSNHDGDIELLDYPSPSTLLGDESDVESVQSSSETFVNSSDARVALNPGQTPATSSPLNSLGITTYPKRRALEYYCHQPNNLILTPHMDVELENENFLRISSIFETVEQSGSTVFLEGLLFLRVGVPRTMLRQRNLVDDDEDLSCLFLPRPNEIFWSVNMLEDDGRDEKAQSLRVFPVSHVIRPRHIKITNQIYPKLNALVERSDSNISPNFEDSDDVLVCRWKGIRTWPTALIRKKNTLKYCRRTIARMRAEECDLGCAIKDSLLMDGFRNTTKRGGTEEGIHALEVKRKEWEEKRAREAERARPFPSTCRGATIVLDTPPVTPIEILDEPEFLVLNDDEAQDSEAHQVDSFWKATSTSFSPWVRSGTRRYTFADIFCGFGGATRAAVAAGLCVLYSNDIEKDMCDSYRKNFPWVRVACCDARVFASTVAYLDIRVDILHLSNPCQPFSRAHTTPGQNDEKNSSMVHLIEAFLLKAKPRIATMENADGILLLPGKNWEYIEYLIRQFTVMDYSVEFRVMSFADYGVCQRRPRFVLIASCPGQKLPGFPKPTHSDPKKVAETGLQSWIGIGDAIDHIPDKWDHHDPASMCLVEKQEYPRERMCSTLLTKNSELFHYCGFRKFTVQELLAIQTFPLYHEFGDNQLVSLMEKQVGNAVPPKPFALIFEHIKLELLKDDTQEEGEDVSCGRS